METDLATANVMTKLIRMIWATLDMAAYWLLGIAYKLFFNVASADLFSNDTIMKFYGRVQVILGVFMMFQLSLTILKGIADPDSFVGEKGTGKALITKIITALVMLTVLMPISIPSPKNEYEIQINNNGLLFGTLYSLQHRILSNNTLGRLILGTKGTTNTYKASTNNDDDLAKSSRIFTSTILKGFYRINLVPEEERDEKYLKENKDPAAYNENRVCKDISDDALNKYTRLDGDSYEIVNLAYETCSVDFNIFNSIPGLDAFLGSKKYAFTQVPFVPCVVAIVFVFILLSFTVDVAVRAVKLAVLRLIAPIPIISYMDPKGSKDGAFNQWVKTLTSTYLDLFIRLAVIYFVIFIIQDTMVNGIVMDAGSGIYSILTYIAIYIGLFIFAKQAPKFFRQVLGMKEDAGGKLFGGFGELMGAAALGTGLVGSFNASREASRQADIANGKDPTTLRNKGKHILSGIGGGISGGITGLGAWQGAKDHQGKAVTDAIQKRNTTAMEKGLSGSTLFGRAGATATRAFRGDGATAFDAETRGIQQKKDIEKSAKDLFSYLEGKGKTDGASYTVTSAKVKDASGNEFQVTDSVDSFRQKKQEAMDRARRSGGPATFDIVDSRGNVHTINAEHAIASKIEEELAYAAGDMWAQGDGANDSGFIQKQATYNESIRGASDPNSTGLYVEYGGSHTASKLKKTSKAAGGEAVRGEANPGYKRRQANYGASKKS